ncbi:mandelate racemase/muconate lactonizing enzyme family protein [Ruania zhangjianzhongii]|uniref:mandelate racemase/muconate lactonizing enzyme family protein n=1 Tax=Ruania zhangjianzhongii TaxID=2603206 RepID=UPI0011C8CABE|nr:mandelate racemase/muconate lactonizing enzyme family protein [Ruania zhangjianzhongii]
MKIERVSTHVIMEELPIPFGMSQWFWTSRASCLVEIETTDGTIGWGECFGPAEPNRALIESVFADLVIGADPWERISLWEAMYNKNREWGRKGLPIAAISGIEIALWDIAGKQTGLPVYKLLGGRLPEELAAYASGFYYGGEWKDDIEAEAAHLIGQGYRYVKMKIGADLPGDIARVTRARAALGEDVQLAVDANRGYTPTEAMAFGRATRDLNLWFFEEPVIPEDLDGYREVRSALDVPIAGGESEFTRWGMRQLMESRAVDVLQPDATACGGLREAVLIAEQASAHGIPTLPHVWGSAITLAAGLHLATALPVVTPSMGRAGPVIELDQAPNTFRDHLSSLDLGPVLHVPEGPGLGIEIDRSLIEAYRV